LRAQSLLDDRRFHDVLHRLDGAFVEGEQRVSILAQAVGRRLVGMKVIGSVNLGFVLIALNYLLSWLLAILYGRIAQSKFDPLAARAVSDASEGVPK
jgi:hypothetical protein